MKYWVFGSAALLMVAACGGDASSNETGAVAAQDGENLSPEELDAMAANADIRPLAGQYRSNITLLSFDMPDAPPQMADMMSSMFSRSFEYCLTQEEVDEGFKSMTRRSQEGDCTFQRFNAAGGRIDAEMTCNADGRPMKMVMQGTGTPTSADITMTMSGDMGMGNGSMKLRSQHERIGNCGG